MECQIGLFFATFIVLTGVGAGTITVPLLTGGTFLCRSV